MSSPLYPHMICFGQNDITNLGSLVRENYPMPSVFAPTQKFFQGADILQPISAEQKIKTSIFIIRNILLKVKLSPYPGKCFQSVQN